MAAKDWDIAMFKKMSELAKEFDLKCPIDQNNWINTDDSMADAAWQAAVKFVTDVGCLCLDRERVVKFTEDEVKEAIRWVVTKHVFLYLVFCELDDSLPVRGKDGPQSVTNLTGGSLRRPCLSWVPNPVVLVDGAVYIEFLS